MSNTSDKLERELKKIRLDKSLISERVIQSIVSFIGNLDIRVLKANNNSWVELDFQTLTEEDPFLAGYLLDNFEDCNKSMDGILFDGWGVNRKGDIDLGEAPGAYKNIDQVIEDQSDIIKPLVKLKPLAVIKAREIGGKNEV